MLIVMQGAPGSGKSTVARLLAQAQGAHICSTDDYFMVPQPNGTTRYVHNPDMLAEYHRRNLERTIKLLAKGESVIVDNANIRCRPTKPYVEAALKYGHQVQFIRVEGRFPSSHGVPPDIVERMRCKP